MVNMMKALVFTAPHTFEYRDVPRPEPAPDEVLVEVKACAICGSDVHGSSGENGRRIPPLVMGHEASGTIAQLGEAVQGWAVGDRVTFDSTEYCGHCWFCTHGMHNLCAQRRIVGVACTEYRKNGAMAQYIAVKARTLYALSPTVSFEQGCLVEPFAVGMHAVLRSGLAAGQTAAVIGDGTIGLMTLIAAKSEGAQVCISGHHTRPMQLAAQLGALDWPWSWCARADASWSSATMPGPSTSRCSAASPSRSMCSSAIPPPGSTRSACRPLPRAAPA